MRTVTYSQLISTRVFIQSQNSGSQSNSASLIKPDASPKGGDRRGSRVSSSVDEGVPLTYKTGTVGIVALAIRNKNEMKKEREFKVSLQAMNVIKLELGISTAKLIFNSNSSVKTKV